MFVLRRTLCKCDWPRLLQKASTKPQKNAEHTEIAKVINLKNNALLNCQINWIFMKYLQMIFAQIELGDTQKPTW